MRPRARCVVGTTMLAVLLALGGCASLPGGSPQDPEPPVTSPSDDAAEEPTEASPSDPPSDPPSEEPPADPAAGDSVTADLTVEVDLSGEGPVESWTLTCEPAGGDHPDPEAACAALAAAGGATALQPPEPGRMCTQQYGGPEVATVRGTVDGEPVHVRLDRTDGCGIGEWGALVGLLPAGGAR